MRGAARSQDTVTRSVRRRTSMISRRCIERLLVEMMYVYARVQANKPSVAGSDIRPCDRASTSMVVSQ